MELTQYISDSYRKNTKRFRPLMLQHNKYFTLKEVQKVSISRSIETNNSSMLQNSSNQKHSASVNRNSHSTKLKPKPYPSSIIATLKIYQTKPRNRLEPIEKLQSSIKTCQKLTKSDKFYNSFYKDPLQLFSHPLEHLEPFSSEQKKNSDFSKNKIDKVIRKRFRYLFCDTSREKQELSQSVDEVLGSIEKKIKNERRTSNRGRNYIRLGDEEELYGLNDVVGWKSGSSDNSPLLITSKSNS
jgi:hypothetical protein